jgi:hypothetical protein
MMDVQIRRSRGNTHLTVTNRGRSASFVFDPELPFGAHLLGSECGSRDLTAHMERNPHDEHARLTFAAPTGIVECAIRFQGGVEVVPQAPDPLLGDPSTVIKITDVRLGNDSLIVEADVNIAGASSFEIKTPWKSASVEGGRIRQIAGELYQIDLDHGATAPGAFGYAHRTAVIHFESGAIR